MNITFNITSFLWLVAFVALAIVGYKKEQKD